MSATLRDVKPTPERVSAESWARLLPTTNSLSERLHFELDRDTQRWIRRSCVPSRVRLRRRSLRWNHPATVGILLALCPPLGVTLLWALRDFPREGRLVLTLFGLLTMALMVVIGANH